MERNPVEFYRSDGFCITSPYGERIHPRTKELSFHYGTDLACKPKGYPIRTPFAGKVLGAGTAKVWGNFATIRSMKNGVVFLFAHMDETVVQPGQTVAAGDVIGRIGSTGWSTGDHLHFELRLDNGTQMGGPCWGNPANYFEEVEDMATQTYTVKAGDTLAKIAAAHGTTVEDLIALNGITDPNRIFPGDVLVVKKEDPAITPAGDRAPYDYEISGLQTLVDLGIIQANTHNPAAPATIGLLGTIIGRLRFETIVETAATTKIRKR